MAPSSSEGRRRCALRVYVPPHPYLILRPEDTNGVRCARVVLLVVPLRRLCLGGFSSCSGLRVYPDDRERGRFFGRLGFICMDINLQNLVGSRRGNFNR